MLLPVVAGRICAVGDHLLMHASDADYNMTPNYACTASCVCMQATAVIERIRRAISETSDAVNLQLQPISSAFGKAFKVTLCMTLALLEPFVPHVMTLSCTLKLLLRLLCLLGCC